MSPPAMPGERYATVTLGLDAPEARALIRANQRLNGPPPGVPMLQGLWGGGVLLLGALALAMFLPGSDPILLGVVGVVSMAYPSFALRHLVTKTLRELQRQPMTVHVHTGGLAVEAGGARAFEPWSDFTGAAEDALNHYFAVDHIITHVVPKRLLDADAREKLTARTRQLSPPQRRAGGMATVLIFWAVDLLVIYLAIRPAL